GDEDAAAGAGRRVAVEGVALERQGTALVVDAAAGGGGVAVFDDRGGDGETIAGVEDGSAVVGAAAGERQAADGDVESAGTGHVKEAAGVIAAEGEQAGPRSLDGEALVDSDLTGAEGDGLAVQRRVEGDDIAGGGGGNHGAQSAGRAVVEGAGD